MTEPIRKSLLPATPPPEWEVTTVGGKTGAVIRRQVSYGDWEPVLPGHWADEPADARGAARTASGQQPEPTVAPPADDLPDRLRHVLTERFTELGNPFSEMRIQFKGPDGWPASKPVGPNAVAEVLRELLAVPAVGQPAAAQATDEEESSEDAVRRFARRLNAVERLVSGRPGYHQITVKELLTAMSDEDDTVEDER